MLAARAVGTRGVRVPLIAAMVAIAAGCALLARLPLTAVLPGMVLVAAGTGPGFAAGTIAATAGVPADEQGAAAALLSTATQVGAAVGLGALGVLSALAADPAGGARVAFAAMAAAAVLAALVATLLPGRPHRAPVPVPVAVPAHASGCVAGCADFARDRSKRFGGTS